MKSINYELNAMKHNLYKVCADCGRSFPSVVLNIEGVIHHGQSEYKCVDRKDCERAKRKRK